MEIKPKAEPIIAKTDKVCYKILYKINPLERDAESLLKCHEDELIYKTNIMMPNIELVSVREKFSNGFKWFVDMGYHSRTKVNSEERVVRLDCNNCWYKCIIPKGAKYYEGMDENNRESYSSDSIMVIELIETESFYEKIRMKKEYSKMQKNDRKSGR